MRIYALVLALGGFVGATMVAQAQTATLPPGPLEKLQDIAGKATADSFNVPDPIFNSPAATAPDAPGPVLGRAVRTTLQIPGAIFAGMYQPFAAAEAPPAPAPAPAAPAPRHHRHRHAGSYHRVTPATAG